LVGQGRLSLEPSTIGRGTGELTMTPLPQPNAYAMIRRRAVAAGIATKVGNQERRDARKSSADGQSCLDTHDAALRSPCRGSDARRRSKGHSIGCFVVLRAIEKHPETTRKIRRIVWLARGRRPRSRCPSARAGTGTPGRLNRMSQRGPERPPARRCQPFGQPLQALEPARRRTANSAERNLTAVMAVPNPAVCEKLDGSIGSNGSASPSHLLESVREAY
jgi:hypothetical protein